MLALPGLAAAQHIAWLEGDGESAGFRAPGLSTWSAVATPKDGVLLATRGNDWLELATPVRNGVVWYAVTLRMQTAIDGYASVVPAERPGQQVSELGFDSKLGSSEGLWTTGRKIATTGLAATTRQTFLQRYDLDHRTWSAWASVDDGRALVAADGSVTAAALVSDATLNTAALGAVYLTKGSAQVLEIHRLAFARTAREALTPVTAASRPRLESRPKHELAESALPTAGIAAFAERSALPRGGTIAFFGDSLTWQGGHVARLRDALAAARPDLAVQLLQRGINGGKSTDLVAGVKDLYGSTQAPFREVLAADRPAAIVVQIGINDVWHKERGNAPPVFEAALRTLLAAAAERGVPVLLCTPTVIGERRAGTNAFDTALEVLCDVVRRLAAEPERAAARVRLCDLRRGFTELLAQHNGDDRDRGVLTYDGVHLSAAGNALLAHLLGQGLHDLLGETAVPEVPFALVPWPRALTPGTGTVRLVEPITIASDALLREHAAVLAAELRAVTGLRTELVASGPATIELALAPDLPSEHATMSVAAKVTVKGRDLEALARGTASLVQLLHDEGGTWSLPCLELADAPTCSYRGLLVDVARKPHSIAVLEELVELCRFYKLRYLQLHLTDDQAFTFPSRAFPKLATKGHSFLREELVALHAFAVARGVTIVPELDVPGHCGAMIAAMPELFAASTKHHATIAFAKPEVLAAVDTLLGELLEVFPSTPYLHVGGDEADLEHVHENPAFVAAFAREGVANAQQLYRRFLCQLRERVVARGRKMLVWEGFGPEGGVAIPTDVTVMEFEMLYHLPDKLVAAGYPLINASWRPLYVVNERCWSEREIYLWDRGRFRHFVPDFPAYAGIEVPREKVLGAQLCAWEQPQERELPSLRRRVPALAERVWNEAAGRDVEDFLARLTRTDARLSVLLKALR